MEYELDEYQKKAVMCEDNNTLVVAAPGAGKTTVIINRVNYLINIKKINPNNIIVITFTKAAAINMKKKYEKISISKRIPFFGTFHGLFYKILSHNKIDVKIIEGNIVYKLINKVLTSYIDEVSEDKVKEIINAISYFKSREINLEEFNPDMDKEIFHNCYREYEEYKQKNNLMDFDDLQLNVKKLFKENSRLLNGYRKLFKHILVDEFQDCDEIQLKILKMLNKDNYIYAVGDEDQCIYGFRGSKPECMVNFENIFENGKKLMLGTNYRSKRNIVETSKELIKNNKMRNQKEIKYNKKEEGIIKVIINIDESNEAEEIASIILKYKNEKNNYKDFVILYRTNVESRRLIDVFIRKNIPFKLIDKQYNFFENFICKDILAYLKLSMDARDKESFCRIINKPFRYISKINIDKVRRNINKEDCFEMLKDIEELPIFQIKKIDDLKCDIQNLNRVSLSGAIHSIITTLGYDEYLSEYCRNFKIAKEELDDIVYEFQEAASEYTNILSFIEHVNTVSEELVKIKRESMVNEDAALLSTIHGVKGMEFKNVIIINCCEEIMPHKNSMENENRLEEERRLFYVGITRAIENLWVSTVRNIRGKPMEVSRFLVESKLCEKEMQKTLFKKGDKVKHLSFGVGEVLYCDERVTEILFFNNIKRKFDSEVLIKNKLVVLC